MVFSPLCVRCGSADRANQPDEDEEHPAGPVGAVTDRWTPHSGRSNHWFLRVTEGRGGITGPVGTLPDRWTSHSGRLGNALSVGYLLLTCNGGVGVWLLMELMVCQSGGCGFDSHQLHKIRLANKIGGKITEKSVWNWSCKNTCKTKYWCYLEILYKIKSAI